MWNLLTNVVTDSNTYQTTKATSVEMLLGMAVNFFLAISSGLFLVSLAVTMVQFILSSGDPKAIDKAQKALTWTVISGIVILLSVAIKVVLLNAANVTDADLINDNPTFK
jgi:hypothetical protein